MKLKKEPHFTMWIVIAVLVVNQSVMMHQNFQDRQKIRNQISEIREQILELNQYDTESLGILKDVLSILDCLVVTE